MSNKETDKEFVEKVHNLGKVSLKDKVRDVFTFTKFLVGFSFAIAIGFLGAYAIVKGLHDTGLKRDAFVVSGACAVVQGLHLMWVQVIRKK